jgi:hypothetical protein
MVSTLRFPLLKLNVKELALTTPCNSVGITTFSFKPDNLICLIFFFDISYHKILLIRNNKKNSKQSKIIKPKTFKKQKTITRS